MNTSFDRFFNDFQPGQKILHPIKKTITTGEHQLFTLLTMNHHPIHVDKEFASTSEFGRTLVNGTYVFSLVVGLTVPDISYNAIANLGYGEIQHHQPVFEGDTMRAESVIISTNTSKSRPQTGIVEIATTGFKADAVVISFTRKILIPSRHA